MGSHTACYLARLEDEVARGWSWDERAGRAHEAIAFLERAEGLALISGAEGRSWRKRLGAAAAWGTVLG